MSENTPILHQKPQLLAQCFATECDTAAESQVAWRLGYVVIFLPSLFVAPVLLLQIATAIFFAPPVTATVAPTVRNVIILSHGCSRAQQVSVEPFEILSVGAYHYDSEGWPVTAKFAITCSSGEAKYSYASPPAGERVAYIKEFRGSYHAFIPNMYGEFNKAALQVD